MQKMILFDIDGTLLYAGGAGCLAIDRAFEDVFGIRHAWNNIRPDGKTDFQIFEEILLRHLQRSFVQDEYDSLCAHYLFHFHREIQKSERFRVLPGVCELLAQLSQHEDFILGIATGNIEESAWLKLKQGGIDRHFRFGGFGSDSSQRVELTRKSVERGFEALGREIPRQNIFLIGDAPQDIAAGKALGLVTIGVASGHPTSEELARHQPDYLLPDLTDREKFLSLLG